MALMEADTAACFSNQTRKLNKNNCFANNSEIVYVETVLQAEEPKGKIISIDTNQA